MGLPDIFLLGGIFLALRLIPRRNVRLYGLILCTVLFLFRLQPIMPIREMDYWLPSVSILLTFLTWALVCGWERLKSRENLIEIGVTVLLMLLIPLTRGFSYDGIFTASRPPVFGRALVFVLAGLLLIWGAARWGKKGTGTLIAVLLLVLVILKTEPLSARGSSLLRTVEGQSSENAAASDLRWLGVSYLFFRLLSTLIDAGKGRKFAFSAGEYLVFACFPPALSAGPIDRAERFCKNWESAPAASAAEDLQNGGIRLAKGLAKKFLIADQLALFALSPANAGQFVHSGWAWVSLAAYGLQLYFDFSGCTDIAIGLGVLLGIHLPENFDHPYLKGDLTRFWAAWHMTLTQWIRSYVFNPLARQLRSNKEHPLPKAAVVLICQLVTMLLIGLWHGVSLNLVIWGLWHGIGLFIHQQYSQKYSGSLRKLEQEKPGLKKVYNAAGLLLTDFYILLGWIWFVLPDFSSALGFFRILF